MNILTRGLYALVLLTLLQTQLTAKYLYKDELISNPKFEQDVEDLGSELYEKTGISLKLLMLQNLPEGQSLVEYENEILKEFSEPTVALIFSEKEKNVDIFVSDPSLYEYFNKKQVLSPVASSAQAVVMSVIFAEDFAQVKEFIKNSGGTILPLLGNTTKGSQLGKYSAAMYNGYLDVSMQIAKAKQISLKYGVGESSSYPLLIVKIVFYLFIVYALYLYIKVKIRDMKAKNAKE